MIFYLTKDNKNTGYSLLKNCHPDKAQTRKHEHLPISLLLDSRQQRSITKSSVKMNILYITIALFC